MKPIIKVENLSKRYRIGTHEAPYTTLRETLAKAFRAPFKRPRNGRHSNDETVWALKDVSFEVQQGEVLGIIGRNGSGKSTLLKVLSRITEPTSGRVELHGRVNSMLEVGTGFHPELTGRENIYLNGTILGMGRTEIRRKFDEIVAFSEIAKFIDTPVKYYSSGMYLRLAFAVAAHLEPEILIVDEVLSVGDAAFQKKCLGKMQESNRQGRTVLFVSHDMSSVKTLCTRGILLDGGRIALQGAASWVTEQYLTQIMGPQRSRIAFPEDPDLRMQFLHVELVDSVDNQGQEVVRLNCEYVVRTELENILLTVEIRNAADVSVFYSNDQLLEDSRKRRVGTHTVALTIPKYLLAPGDYHVAFGFWEPGRPPEHFPSERLTFRREEPLTRLSAHGIPWPGLLYLPGTWHYVERECQV
jgi:lipopolysaccharide transport system ATP-binding protein